MSKNSRSLQSRRQENLDPMYADTAKEMRGRSQKWLEETDDPILKNAVPQPPLKR